MVALGSIATQTNVPTKKTFDLVTHLLNYVSTYQNDGIVHRKSNIQLAAHSNAGCLNESKAKGRASAHIYLSEGVPTPTFNGVVLTIAHVIKYVMSSAEKA